MTKEHTTEIARLRMEIRTPSRVVLRVVDIATATPLPIAAKTIRIARHWLNQDRHYQFRAGGRTWSSAAGRRNGGVEPAARRHLREVLDTSKTFEFIHEAGIPGTAVQLTADEITTGDRPETDYARLHDAAGTLAIEDLSDEDGFSDLFERIKDKSESLREYAAALLFDDAERARNELMIIDMALESLRNTRRGPLLRHRPDPGPEREDPEILRRTTEWADRGPTPGPEEAAVRLTVREGDPRPEATVKDGKAHFIDPPRGDEPDHDEVYYDTDEELDRAMLEHVRRAPWDMRRTEFYGRDLISRSRHRVAIAVLKHTVDFGLAALPHRYDGPVETEGNAQGLAFVNAASALAELYCVTGSRAKGIRLYERVLLWEPDRDSYARARLGSEYIAEGRVDDAIKHLTIQRAVFAPSSYDLALCHIIKKNWGRAAAAVLQGAATNPYIAEMLTGNRSPMPAPNGEPERWGRSLDTARAYALRYQYTWRRIPDARPFLRWMTTHPRAVRMIAEIREHDYDAAFITDEAARTMLNARFADEVEKLSERWGEMPTETLVRKGSGTTAPWTILACRE